MKPTKETIKQVKRIVGDYSILDNSEKRSREYIYPRHFLAWYLRNRTFLSLSKIGDLLGKKDHATIGNSVATAQELIETNDKKFYDHTKSIQEELELCVFPEHKRYEDQYKELVKRILESRDLDDLGRLKKYTKNKFK